MMMGPRRRSMISRRRVRPSSFGSNSTTDAAPGLVRCCAEEEGSNSRSRNSTVVRGHLTAQRHIRRCEEIRSSQPAVARRRGIRVAGGSQRKVRLLTWCRGTGSRFRLKTEGGPSAARSRAWERDVDKRELDQPERTQRLPQRLVNVQPQPSMLLRCSDASLQEGVERLGIET